MRSYFFITSAVLLLLSLAHPATANMDLLDKIGAGSGGDIATPTTDTGVDPVLEEGLSQAELAWLQNYFDNDVAKAIAADMSGNGGIKTSTVRLPVQKGGKRLYEVLINANSLVFELVSSANGIILTRQFINPEQVPQRVYEGAVATAPSGINVVLHGGIRPETAK